MSMTMTRTPSAWVDTSPHAHAYNPAAAALVVFCAMARVPFSRRWVGSGSVVWYRRADDLRPTISVPIVLWPT